MKIFARIRIRKKNADPKFWLYLIFCTLNQEDFHSPRPLSFYSLYICLLIYLPINLFIYLCNYLSIHTYVYHDICQAQFIYVFFYQSFLLCIYLFIRIITMTCFRCLSCSPSRRRRPRQGSPTTPCLAQSSGIQKQTRVVPHIYLYT